MRVWGAVLAAAIALTACDAPITARNETALEISGALGAPVMPLPSGAYHFIRSGEPTENSVEMAVDAVVQDTNRPLYADVFVMQAHAPSQSYATSYGNLRLYPHEGDVMIAELYGAVSESVFFPARVDVEAQQLRVYEYYCDVYPQAEREALGLSDQCRVESVEALRAALNALALDELQVLRFDWVMALPDRG